MTLTLLAGFHAIRAQAKANPEALSEVWFDDKRRDKRSVELFGWLASLGVRCRYVSTQQLDQRYEGVHQGVLALVKAQQQLDLLSHLARLEHAPLVLALDGITDPHNLGACLRSAEALGADAALWPQDRSAQLSSPSAKAASGALAWLPTYPVANLAHWLEKLSQQGFQVIGLASESEQSIETVNWSGPTVMVVGAEQRGLRTLTRNHCDALCAIKHHGQTPSLNVSVACAIALYVAQQRRKR